MAKYQRRSDIIAADMNGEKVMMDITTGKYYNLGEVGGRIWELLENPLSNEELISKLLEEYDVSAEQCAADVAPFIEKMLSIGLISEI